ALSQKGYHDQAAITEFREAVRVAPSDSAVRLRLAQALDRSGNLDEAVAVYKEAIRRQPNSASFHAELAGVLRKLAKLDQAMEADRQALALKNANLFKPLPPLKPDDFSGHLSRAWSLAQNENPELRAPKQALEAAMIAVQLNSRHRSAWNNLGVALNRNGEWK